MRLCGLFKRPELGCGNKSKHLAATEFIRIQLDIKPAYITSNTVVFFINETNRCVLDFGQIITTLLHPVVRHYTNTQPLTQCLVKFPHFFRYLLLLCLSERQALLRRFFVPLLVQVHFVSTRICVPFIRVLRKSQENRVWAPLPFR